VDDSGLLRSPKWLRSFSPEDRLDHARVPIRFREFSEPGMEAPTGGVEWMDQYERGDLLRIGGNNPVNSAKRASWILGALVRKGESARWIASEDYVTLFKDEWEDDSEGRLWRELKYIARGYDVLVIDGLGEEPNTDFERKILASLVRTRIENGLTVVATTPLSTVDMAHYSKRMAVYFEEGTTLGR
jgi:hypothetical protein